MKNQNTEKICKKKNQYSQKRRKKWVRTSEEKKNRGLIRRNGIKPTSVFWQEGHRWSLWLVRRRRRTGPPGSRTLPGWCWRRSPGQCLLRRACSHSGKRKLALRLPWKKEVGMSGGIVYIRVFSVLLLPFLGFSFSFISFILVCVFSIFFLFYF